MSHSHLGIKMCHGPHRIPDAGTSPQVNTEKTELIGLGRPAQNGPVKPYVQLLDRIYIDVPPSHIKPQESGSDREAFFSEIYRDFMVDFGYTT